MRERSTTGQGSANVNARGDEAARGQIRTSRTTITAQQQSRLRQAVFEGRRVQRLNRNRINFALRTGVFVPRTVALVSVAAFPVIYDVFPAYRPYSFFVVEDDVVFVDSGHRIVDVVPLEGAGVAFASGGGGAAIEDIGLTELEIREVQQVLIAEGFAVEVTGVWDVRTREALISFQRRRGLPAIGRIDTRTVAALRLTDRINARHIRDGGRATATTRGDVSRPRSGAPDAAARRDEQTGRRSQERSTTGSGGEQPRATQDRNEPTTGRGAEPRGSQPRAEQSTPSRQPQMGERNGAPRSTTGQGGARGGNVPQREPNQPAPNR